MRNPRPGIPSGPPEVGYWPPTPKDEQDLGRLAQLLVIRLDEAGIPVRATGFVIRDDVPVAQVEVWPVAEEVAAIEELTAPFRVEVTVSSSPLPRRLDRD